MPARDSVFRPMRADDVPAVMEVQEPTSVAGLSGVFPQDAHPVPARGARGPVAGGDRRPGDRLLRDRAGGRRRRLRGDLAGDEVMHFGVALEEWGSGLA